MKIWIIIWYLALVLVSTKLPQCNTAGGATGVNSKAVMTTGSTLLDGVKVSSITKVAVHVSNTIIYR